MPIATSDLTRKEALLAEMARDLKNVPARVPAPVSDPVLAQFNAVGRSCGSTPAISTRPANYGAKT